MRIFAKFVGGIIVLCFVLGLSFPTHAQYPPPYSGYPPPNAEYRSPKYIVLKGGIYSPQNGKLNNLETGFNGEVAFGNYFNKYFALEVGTGYFQTRTTMTTDTSAETKLDFNVVPLTIAFKGIIPLDKFELYGIGGGGAYFLWTNTSTSTDNRYRSSYNNNNKTLAGGFLGLGATVKVSPKVFLGLEGKYLWTSTVTIQNNNNTYSYNTDINMNGIIATLNVGFLF